MAEWITKNEGGAEVFGPRDPCFGLFALLQCAGDVRGGDLWRGVLYGAVQLREKGCIRGRLRFAHTWCAQQVPAFAAPDEVRSAAMNERPRMRGVSLALCNVAPGSRCEHAEDLLLRRAVGGLKVSHLQKKTEHQWIIRTDEGGACSLARCVCVHRCRSEVLIEGLPRLIFVVDIEERLPVELHPHMRFDMTKDIAAAHT